MVYFHLRIIYFSGIGNTVYSPFIHVNGQLNPLYSLIVMIFKYIICLESWILCALFYPVTCFVNRYLSGRLVVIWAVELNSDENPGPEFESCLYFLLVLQSSKIIFGANIRKWWNQKKWFFSIFIILIIPMYILPFAEISSHYESFISVVWKVNYNLVWVWYI